VFFGCHSEVVEYGQIFVDIQLSGTVLPGVSMLYFSLLVSGFVLGDSGLAHAMSSAPGMNSFVGCEFFVASLSNGCVNPFC
jgi:hypothetical protein